MSGPIRPFAILRREPAAPPAPCPRCAELDAVRRDLEAQRTLTQERRLEIVLLQQELEELRRRPAAPPAPRASVSPRASLLDGPSIGEIPLTGRRIPRRAES